MRDSLEESLCPIVLGVAAHQFVEPTRVVGLLEMDQLVEQHVVDHPVGHGLEPAAQPDLAGADRARPPATVLPSRPADAMKPGQQVQLAGELHLLARLHGVSWSTRQNSRWGSCTISTGEIRLSRRLQPMPNWVIDYVLFHELIHLEEANHSRRFHELMRRYPQHDRAQGFLQGVAHALANGSEPWPSDVDDDPDHLPTEVAD